MPLDRLSPANADTFHIIKPLKDVGREIIHKPSTELTASETSCVPLLQQKQITFIKQAQPSILLCFIYLFTYLLTCLFIYCSLGEKAGGRQTGFPQLGQWRVSRCEQSQRAVMSPAHVGS